MCFPQMVIRHGCGNTRPFRAPPPRRAPLAVASVALV